MVLTEDADAAKIVALGSNLGFGDLTPMQTLEQALDRLSDAGLVVVKRSGWWRSAAWPDETQPAFLNGAALVATSLSPEATLAALHRIEAGLGRDREHALVNAPRTLDLDLIAWGRLIQPGPPVLPHPRATRRRFVMGPLSELLPDWRDPVSGRTAPALASEADVGADSSPLSGAWGSTGGAGEGAAR